MDKLAKIVTLGIFLSYILAFSISLSSLAIMVRYLLFFVIILIEFKSFKFTRKKNIFFLFYIICFFVYPTLMILLGIYDKFQGQIINNIFYFLLFLLAVEGIATYYKKSGSIYSLSSDLKNILSITILFFSIIYKDLSFNLLKLLRMILNNSRQDRSYIGFVNPNQVAIFSSIGIVCTLICFLYNKKNKKKSLIEILQISFFSIVIINTGSRTPIFTILLTLVFAILFELYNKLKPLVKYMIQTVIFSLIFISSIVMFNLIQNPSFLSKLNELSTNRISRQLNTFILLHNDGKLATGYGMWNTSFFNSLPQFQYYHTDSYYTFIVATMGMIGLIGVLFFLVYLLSVTRKNYITFFVIIFSIIYSFFEATLIFPTSIISLFFLITALISIRETNKK